MTELSTLRLVGRGAELRRVEGALREFSQGRDSAPALLSVHGEAGVGKTRLIEEAAARENFSEHGRRPLRWIWTRCLPHGPTHPWHPIRALFTSLAGIEPEDLLTDRARKVESAAESHGWPSAAVDAVRYLLSLPTADSAWPDLAPGERQHRLFANLSEILNAIGAEQPTVLCIEDFHWADSVTLQWLDAHLTSQASTRSRSRVLPVVLHRPEFHHLWPAGVHREDVGLKPLSASDSEILLREVFGLDFGSEEKPEPLWSQLVDRTRGNPFFLEEAIRLLLDRGDIEQAPGGGLRLARPAEDILLPESPRGLVEERVSRLERRLRHLLQCASVIGPEVRSPLLAHLADFERDLDAPLRTLMDEQLLKQREAVGGLALLFRHAITQEVTYATVLRRRREELHARLGEYLEERHQGHLEEAAELLAHHYGASNRPQKAMTYLRLAAEHALNLCAHEAAEAHLDRLNATLRSNRDEIADADEAEGWVALTRGRLARLRGDFAGACEILQEAANGAAALNDLSSGLTRVRLLRALGETERQRGHIAEATALQHRALQACERLPAQDPEKRARPEIQREMVQCLMGLAIALRAAGQFDGAMGLLRRAEATAREIGDLRSLASAKNNRGICLMNLGKPQEALKPLEETVSLRRELGDRCNLVPALNNLGIALERLLELDRALAVFGEALRLAYEIGHHRAVLANHINVGQLLQWLDNQREAMRHFHNVIDVCTVRPDEVAQSLALINLGWSHCHTGQLKLVNPLLENAEQLAKATGDHSTLIHSLLLRSHWESAEGRPRDGLRAAADAFERITAAGGGDELTTAVRLRAEAERRLGSLNVARLSLQEATAAAREQADHREAVLILLSDIVLAEQMRRPFARRLCERRARRTLDRYPVPLLRRKFQETVDSVNGTKES